MPIDLRLAAAPATTAVVFTEMQNALVGSLAGDSPIAVDAVANGVIERCAVLATAARAAGVRVVHCIKTERADGRGSSLNTPMWKRRVRLGFDPLIPGSAAAAVIPELGPEPADIVCSRQRGVTAFGGTELDQILHNMGVATVVVAGISANVGIIAACTDAVSCGYEVIVAGDAVGGAPRSYVADVLTYTIAPLAVRTTVAALVDAWATADTTA
ncbi:cysteine hydrolase family protein [Pseudonocardia sp. GCM10023141]|uniref:cysteine hydrolase family protein n=1 Tax=Pseudonocardia sp. GCM10023141 TaxID=3252653 RepID=UPI00361590FB